MGGVQSIYIFTHTPKYVVLGRSVKAYESMIGYFNQDTLSWEEKVHAYECMKGYAVVCDSQCYNLSMNQTFCTVHAPNNMR